jgi:methylmalonyl-CoA mutase
MLEILKTSHKDKLDDLLSELQRTAIQNKNIFEQLMEVCKYASLGQITKSLFEVGGQYRRNM